MKQGPTIITMADDGAGGYNVNLGGISTREASALKFLLDNEFYYSGTLPSAA